jgi:hypothetical protein
MAEKEEEKPEPKPESETKPPNPYEKFLKGSEDDIELKDSKDHTKKNRQG